MNYINNHSPLGLRRLAVYDSKTILFVSRLCYYCFLNSQLSSVISTFRTYCMILYSSTTVRTLSNSGYRNRIMRSSLISSLF